MALQARWQQDDIAVFQPSIGTPMQIRMLATLPRISIDQQVMLPQARLLKIPFEELLALEGEQRSADYDKQRTSYNRNPPVFFEQWIEIPPIILQSESDTLIKTLVEIANPYIKTCVHAIHFFTGIPLLSPRMSAIYFDYNNDSVFQQKADLKQQYASIGAWRMYGTSDKEYALVNNAPVIHISQAEQEAFHQFYQFIISKSSIIQHPTWNALVEPIQLLALPGLQFNTQLILITSALEAFLIPAITQQINAQFKKRFLQLCQVTNETDKQWIGNVYKLRSELIHGNHIDGQLAKLPITHEAFLIRLQQYAIKGFCTFLQYAKKDEVLEEQLQLFREKIDEEAHSTSPVALAAYAQDGNTTTLQYQWNVNQP